MVNYQEEYVTSAQKYLTIYRVVYLCWLFRVIGFVIASSFFFYKLTTKHFLNLVKEKIKYYVKPNNI